MYIGLDSKLNNIHRHLKTVGTKELTTEEVEFTRAQLKLAKTEDLTVGGVLAGYPITMVNNRISAGKIETTVYLNVGNHDTTPTQL